MAKPNYNFNNPIGSTNAMSFYRMSDAPPNWAQSDPSQPDYIANKDQAELPIIVDGEQFEQETEGVVEPLELRSGENVQLVPSIEETQDGSGKKHVVTINAAVPEFEDKVRPVFVDGEEVLNSLLSSGALKLVGGRNVTLSIEDDSIVISAKSSGGEGGGGDCDCPEIVEGEGIDIAENAYGKLVVSLEKGAISDEYVSSISVEKLVQNAGATLILNGGNANG